MIDCLILSHKAYSNAVPLIQDDHAQTKWEIAEPSAAANYDQESFNYRTLERNIEENERLRLVEVQSSSCLEQ